MRDQLIQYVKLLFAGTPDSEDMQQEILQNTLDRYDDLIDQGKTPEAAYRLAIAGLGDLGELLGASTTPSESVPSPDFKTDAPQPAKLPKQKVMYAIAIALYICCAIPVIVLASLGLEILGVCLMFVMIAVATLMIILSSNSHDDEDHKDRDTTENPGKKTWNTAVLVIYLVLSFLTQWWHITWLVFPISRSIHRLTLTHDPAVRKKTTRKIVALSIMFVVVLAVSIVIHFGFGTPVDGEANVDAGQIKNIEIDWASGDITIQTADIDHIRIQEIHGSVIFSQMTYQVQNNTLKLDSAGNLFSFLSGDRELILTLPQDWVCEELEIDCASPNIHISGLTVKTLELDSADCSMYFRGSADQLMLDGAGSEIRLECIRPVSRITMDGNDNKLYLTLPKNCGFQLNTDGTSVALESELAYAHQNGVYIFGDEFCKICIDGVKCYIGIQQATECTHEWDAGYPVIVPGSGQQQTVYTCLVCGETKSEPLSGCAHEWGPGMPAVNEATGESYMIYSCLLCGKRTSQTLDPYQITCADRFTQEMLMEPLQEIYAAGAIVTIKTTILYDADLHLYVNGEFVCSQTAMQTDGTYTHWEFYFTMPKDDVVIELKASGGL